MQAQAGVCGLKLPNSRPLVLIGRTSEWAQSLADDPNRGSFLCCAPRTCPTDAPPVSVDYFIEYNVTYR